jgi:hypothetical protein
MLTQPSQEAEQVTEHRRRPISLEVATYRAQAQVHRLALPARTRSHCTEHEGCHHQGRTRCHPQAVQEARKSPWSLRLAV